jgi:hypothetical protein
MTAHAVLEVFTGDGFHDVLGDDIFITSVEGITQEGSASPVLPFLNMALRR